MAPGQQLNWVDIPSFQRGISWDIENVKELLQSTSILLGNAILSQFNRDPVQFPKLPANQSVYLVLVDGLQRLAVGTALLSSLHKEVICSTPNRPGDQIHFAPLSAHVNALSAYYLHNDAEFAGHPRQAVRDQYITLKQSISDYCLQELDCGRGRDLAQVVVPLFVTRQVALDIYFNFSRLELLSTFIGINTVRVDLGPVDLLRANILDRATDAKWPQADLESIENDLTDALTEDQKPKQDFIPFVNAALKAINSGKGARLFPSWSTGLLKKDVDDFIDFITDFEAAKLTNSYLAEIVLCGKLPASIAFGHYYIDFLHGSKTKPPFFAGGSGADADLHALLICCYRLVIDGTVGRTTDALEGLISGASALSLRALADSMSVKYLGRTVAGSVDPQWLETNLNRIDQKRAPRVFNAMMLPPKTSLGSAFAPLTFGRKAAMFHIDHLIPESLLKLKLPGGIDGQSLRNFAPLPTNQNRSAKATSCSTKLSSGGIYDRYISGATHAVHGYCQWLVANSLAPPYGAALDSQQNLERNSSPDVGTMRIQKIAADLLGLI
jgi:hypothetical protein